MEEELRPRSTRFSSTPDVFLPGSGGRCQGLLISFEQMVTAHTAHTYQLAIQSLGRWHITLKYIEHTLNNILKNTFRTSKISSPRPKSEVPQDAHALSGEELHHIGNYLAAWYQQSPAPKNTKNRPWNGQGSSSPDIPSIFSISQRWGFPEWQSAGNSPEAEKVHGQFLGFLGGQWWQYWRIMARPNPPRFAATQTSRPGWWVCFHLWGWRQLCWDSANPTLTVC